MNIAFIPARGGSKSIPLKNIRMLCERPLIYWTTKASNNASCIDKVIIATDNEKIKNTVTEFNFEKVEIYNRAPQNAQDDSSTESVMLEYINFAKLNDNDNFILIQATSPLLKSEDIDSMFTQYCKSDCDSFFSAVREKQFHWIETPQGIKPINYDYKNRPRRQEFRGILAENGACYINKVENIKKDNCRLSGKIGCYEMSAETAYEIDEEEDFLIIENIMKQRI